MSRDKHMSHREIKSVMLQRCDNMFANLQKENSMNKYLRQSRRESYDYKTFKKVSDCYMGEDQSQKENTYLSTHKCCMNGHFHEAIQTKIKLVVIKHVQKYMKKMFEENKTGLQLFFRNELDSIKLQLESIQQEYEKMLFTFQDICKNMEWIKQKPKKPEKYAKKIELHELQKSIKTQFSQMALKVQTLSKQIQKINQSSIKIVEEKVHPVLLNYDKSSTQISLQDLKVVVDTFNHNFIQIDAKLKELFTHIT